jgi:ssDNA-binding Zn-finger/Zn-ribbon topoisomerase 1
LNRKRYALEEYIKDQCGIILPADEVKEPKDGYLCPECNGEMALRANRQSGEKFWGCKKYPACRGTRDSAGLSKEERRIEKEKVEHQTGFSFNKDKRSPVTEVSPPATFKSPFEK